MEKWMGKRVWETEVIQGPQRPSLSKDPHTHQQGQITRTVARAKQARIVGKDG